MISLEGKVALATGTAVFLASAANYVTGQILVLDGGVLAK